MTIIDKKLIKDATVVYAQVKSKERLTSLGNLTRDAEGFATGVEWAESEIKKQIMSIIELDGEDYTDGEILDLVYEFLEEDEEKK